MSALTTKDVAQRLHRYDLDELIDRGAQIFGDKERFFQWMLNSQDTFNGIRPIDILDSEDGKEELIDTLTVLENAHQYG
ncbi:MbcA/ParS/Xre antitoxin family protein [Pokkaliibacter sp. MBI-7]|uniref:Antitoxin Xre/MbcA/ParS-like toxin-binding domain-containing protein n=1 Tax=Proteobacteria bacterium 228 TaxID=2083153 RepID=A0A2S5KRZ8_9PROT|nr:MULTISPECIES: MbcA/ParS/Xre antitoxin family protein [Pokkaliibacter]MDH2436443.1 MbcA/ParS/Xre antitoxin family protein [Pokkaliibacter sp. MBI-7]PPC77299.1 hypothetical protein C4K68_10515 [Pokkaliibacter plantistimulans]